MTHDPRFVTGSQVPVVQDETRQWLDTAAALAGSAGAVRPFDKKLAEMLADLSTGVIRSLYPDLEEAADEQAEG